MIITVHWKDYRDCFTLKMDKVGTIAFLMSLKQKLSINLINFHFCKQNTNCSIYCESHHDYNKIVKLFEQQEKVLV